MSGANAVRQSASASPATDRRREERRDCSLTGKLHRTIGEFACVVIDMSPHGLRLVVTASAELQIGEKVSVATEIFGSVHGRVRWAAHPRYGFELEEGMQAPPPMMKFYESLSAEKMIEARLKFLNMDEATSAALVEAKPLIDAAMPRCLDEFYKRVRATPGLMSFFDSEDQLNRAKGAQTRHWEDVTTGAFDERYLARVRRIGFTHARIGLEPRWYLGGYAHILSDLASALIVAKWPKSRWGGGSAKQGEATAATMTAIIKTVFLELDLAISTYLQVSEEARLRGEEEAIGTERGMVAKSIGQGLAKLAEKDLTYRMEENLPSAYRALQDNFNVSATFLEDALKGVVATAGGVRTGMNEISSASEDLSRRTEQQAANLEQTAAALNEIKDASRRAAEAAEKARTAMGLASADAQHSGEVVKRTVTTMSKIADSSREINQIIGVVDEIAFQTNLLALNAGVEAARAGEVGRGFAVVASEVRALAQRSSEAAKEIRGLIETASNHVSDGVAQVAEAGASLERIATQVTTINATIAEIAKTTQDQANGLREVTVAVDEMDMLTQQNAAMAEQATAAAASLQRETGTLFALIDQFSVSGVAPHVAPAAPVKARPTPPRAAPPAKRRPSAA